MNARGEMPGQDHQTLRGELTDSIEVVETVPDYPASDSEWQAVCREGGDVWYVEKTRDGDAPNDNFAVYEGEYDRERGHRRRQFLDVFASAEEAAEFINERA